MTEDEAKTKWCPHSQVLETYAEVTSFNRDPRGDKSIPDAHCCGLRVGVFILFNGKLKPLEFVDHASNPNPTQ